MIRLNGADGIVHVPIVIICAISPVVATAVNGAFAESRLREYNLQSHSSEVINFALDFMCGDVTRHIDGEVALELLALADELAMEKLKAACEEALLAHAVTSNAAQLEAAASRYECKELLTAARALLHADSSVLGNLYDERQRLLAARRASVAAQTAAENETSRVDKQLRVVSDKVAHELEQLFRARTLKTAGEASDEHFSYPHAPTAQSVVHFVNPNARNEYFWGWNNGVHPPPGSAILQKTVSKAPKKKKARHSAAGASEAVDAPPPQQVHASIMDAYEAAKPGEVIKLRAGRHAISPVNKDGEPVWEDLVYRKSVQLVADDGLVRSDVLIGVECDADIDDYWFHVYDGVVQVEGADMRVAGVTLLVTGEFRESAGFFRATEGGRLWIEDCDFKLANDKKLDPCFGKGLVPARSRDDILSRGPGMPQMECGLTVGGGSSAFIRRCTFVDADGPAVQIHPNAVQILLERCVISGCGRGGPGQDRSGCRHLPGECGAIEVQDKGLGEEEELEEERGDLKDERDRFKPEKLPPVSVEITVRECHLEGNHGPALSYRPAGDIVCSFDPPKANVAARAAQLARAFTLEQCVVKGNHLHARKSPARVGTIDDDGRFRKMSDDDARAAIGCVWNRATGAEARESFDANYFSEEWYRTNEGGGKKETRQNALSYDRDEELLSEDEYGEEESEEEESEEVESDEEESDDDDEEEEEEKADDNDEEGEND